MISPITCELDAQHFSRHFRKMCPCTSQYFFPEKQFKKQIAQKNIYTPSRWLQTNWLLSNREVLSWLLCSNYIWLSLQLKSPNSAIFLALPLQLIIVYMFLGIWQIAFLEQSIFWYDTKFTIYGLVKLSLHWSLKFDLIIFEDVYTCYCTCFTCNFISVLHRFKQKKNVV